MLHKKGFVLVFREILEYNQMHDKVKNHLVYLQILNFIKSKISYSVSRTKYSDNFVALLDHMFLSQLYVSIFIHNDERVMKA